MKLAAPLFGFILALSVLSLVTLSGAQSTDAVLRERVFDVFERLAPVKRPPASAFHIVTIDADAEEIVGPWPWPRSSLARLITATEEAGARGIVLAEAINGPDPLGANALDQFWGVAVNDDGLSEALRKLPDTDLMLRDALASLPSAASIAPATAVRGRARLNSITARLGDHASDDLSERALELPTRAATGPVSNLFDQSTALAATSIVTDADGRYRRLQPFWSINGEARPSLPLAAAEIALGVDARITDIANTAFGGEEPAVLSLGPRRLDLSPGNAVRLRMNGAPLVGSTSASAVLSGRATGGVLLEKVAIIARDPALSGTIIETPNGPRAFAQTIADAAFHLIDGRPLSRPGWVGYLEAITVMLIGAIAIMITQALGGARAALAVSIVLIAIFASAFAAFHYSALLIDPLPATAAAFLGAFAGSSGRRTEQKLADEASVAGLYGVLPPAAMSALDQKHGHTILNGARRDISVLSCELRILDDDIERLHAHPEDATAMIATASNALRRVILDTGGVADQSDGGKVHAYYNAPLESADYREAACANALRLIESMDKINGELDASTRTRGVQVHLAIGVATGPCLVGPMGHGRSNRYSAIGPTVERAAFLRKQALRYGPAIICDETIFRETHHKYAFLELDRIRPLRNLAEEDAEPTRFTIYALVGNPFVKSSKGFRALDEAHRQLLAAYRNGDWISAGSLIKKIRKLPGTAIPLFDIYEKRIARMSKSTTKAPISRDSDDTPNA